MTLAYDDSDPTRPTGSSTARSKPVVLLLHAGVCDRRMWKTQVESLAPTYRVIAPDLPGFGDSPLEPGEFSTSGELLELLDTLGIDQTAVVGASYGGLVALELAHVAPERVTSLVLLSTALQGLDSTAAVDAFGEEEERLVLAGDLDGAVELNVSTWLGPDADDAARASVRQMQRRAFDVQVPADEWPDPPHPASVEPDLTAIDVPTLVVAGGHDLDFFQHVARHVAASISEARLVDLPWAGHLPTLERPDETAALVADFLNQRA